MLQVHACVQMHARSLALICLRSLSTVICLHVREWWVRCRRAKRYGSRLERGL
jgi:hypothetical protein